MTFVQTMNIIADKIRSQGFSTTRLECLAREVPITPDNQEAAAVGAAVERVLAERYVNTRKLWSTAELAEVLDNSAELYQDRADRAHRDAVTQLLEERYPDVPDPIDSYDEDQGLTYSQYVAAVYRRVEADGK